MTYIEDLAARLDARAAELYAELERVVEARVALVDVEPDAPVIPLAARAYPLMAAKFTETAKNLDRLLSPPKAAVDDVLALVATGATGPTEVAALLGASMASARRRLIELRADDLVYRNDDGQWFPTAKAKRLNWTENRAREIAQGVA